MKIDFGKTSKDYGKYRAGFPERFFRQLFANGTVEKGDRLLDLGTGTGTIARGMAAHGCKVVGIDIAGTMLEQAKLISRQAGLEIDFIVARAEATGFQSQSFDVITAGQCWHWFETEKVITEVKRLLRPGGKLIIAYLDWIPLPGNVVEATEQLILKSNPEFKYPRGNGIHAEWLLDFATNGFTRIETFSFDIDIAYSHEAWRGRVRASSAIAASLLPDEVTRFDEELMELLLRDFPQDPLTVFHRVFAITCKRE